MEKNSYLIWLFLFSIILGGNIASAQEKKLKEHHIVMYDSLNTMRYSLRINSDGYLTDYAISDLSCDTSYKGYLTNPREYRLLSTEDPTNIYGIGVLVDSTSIELNGNKWYKNGNPFVQIGIVSTSPYVIRFYVFNENFSIRISGFFMREVKNGQVTWKQKMTWSYYDLTGNFQRIEEFGKRSKRTIHYLK